MDVLFLYLRFPIVKINMEIFILNSFLFCMYADTHIQICLIYVYQSMDLCLSKYHIMYLSIQHLFFFTHLSSQSNVSSQFMTMVLSHVFITLSGLQISIAVKTKMYSREAFNNITKNQRKTKEVFINHKITLVRRSKQKLQSEILI